jgi:hypothetical protein
MQYHSQSRSDGTTFITTWNPKIIRSDIRFRSQIDSGYGELKITLNRDFDNFGEGNDIAFMNIVKIYESDQNNPTARLIYTGFISQYNPFTNGSDQGVTVTCLGLVSLLPFIAYRDSGNLTFTKTDSPENIISDIITKFSSDYSGLITTDLDATGATSSIKFDKTTSFEGVQSAFGTIGGGFYWYVDEKGVLKLKQNPSTATHTFTIAKDIDILNTIKSSEEVQNDVTLFYTDSLGSQVDDFDNPSIAEFGKREFITDDSRIQNVATANAKVAQILSENKDAKIKTILRINTLFDIESISRS